MIEPPGEGTPTGPDGRPLRVLKTQGPEAQAARDRAQRRDLDEAMLAATLREQGLLLPEGLAARLDRVLRLEPLVLLEGPAGGGKSHLALELARHLTREYEDAGVAVAQVDPTWRSSRDLLGAYDSEASEQKTTAALDLWLAALRHKAKPYFLILEGFDLAPPEAYLADFLGARHPGGRVSLHPGHLRCRPRAAAPPQARASFVCNQDCEACFFVQPGYPVGITDAVVDFVPAQVKVPENLRILGVMTGPVAALAPRVGHAAARVRVTPPSLRELLDAELVGPLGEHEARALEEDERRRRGGDPVPPRSWLAVGRHLAEGGSWQEACEAHLLQRVMTQK